MVLWLGGIAHQPLGWRESCSVPPETCAVRSPHLASCMFIGGPRGRRVYKFPKLLEFDFVRRFLEYALLSASTEKI